MCNRDIEGQKFVCVGVKFLAFNVLLHTKFEQKVIGIRFCAPIIFNNSFKTQFFIRNILITICVKRVWIVIRYFLFEKQATNGLLKVIGIQNIFYTICYMI